MLKYSNGNLLFLIYCMKQIVGLLLISSLCFSCHFKEESIVVLIRINNSNIKKLYLTDAYKWDVFLDSASGGPDYEFNISKKKLPNSLVSICYLNNKNEIKQLQFDNRILSPDSTKYLITAFIPDRDTIEIYGDLKKSRYYLIQAGEETQSLYATQMMNFGFLDADVAKRTSELRNFIDVIKKYPESNYLLSQIYENRTTIKKKELALLLENFKPIALRNGIGKQVKDYMEKKSETTVLSTMILENEGGRPISILNSTAKLNMVILWASWCGPCRREIPEIKVLQKKYKDKGLSIVSISTDDSKGKWQQALSMEKMPWRQLIVPQNLKQQFTTIYEVSSIPDVIFIGPKGNVIERFIGYKEGRSKEYETVINNILK